MEEDCYMPHRLSMLQLFYDDYKSIFSIVSRYSAPQTISTIFTLHISRPKYSAAHLQFTLPRANFGLCVRFYCVLCCSASESVEI